MAKTSFKKPVKKTEDVETLEVTPNEPSTMEAYNGPGGSGWDLDDIRIPYFSLVQKTGALSNDFKPGGFVYNKELSISDGKQPIDITVLRADKYFVEDVPYDPDIRPKRFNTKDEFIEAGFSLDYKSEMRVKEAAELVVLLPVDEDRATLLNGNEGFVRALWVIQSSAFNTVGRTIATAMMVGHLKDGVHRGKWSLTSDLRSNKSMSWFVPVVKSMGRHDGDTLTFIEEQCVL